MQMCNTRSKSDLMKTVLMIVCFIVSGSAIASPWVMPSCKEELKMSFAAERKFIEDQFAAGKGWHVRFEVVSEVYNPQTRNYVPNKTTTEITAGSNFRYNKTTNKEVYADEHDIFTVSRSSYTIMHTHSNPNELKLKDEGMSSVLQDSLLNQMQITDCNRTKMDNKDVVCYHLKSVTRKSTYLSMTIFVDPVTKFILRLSAQMNLELRNEVKEFTFTITQKKQVEVDKSWYNLRSKFLTADGKLKPEYREFKLVEPEKFDPTPVKRNKTKLKPAKSEKPPPIK